MTLLAIDNIPLFHDALRERLPLVANELMQVSLSGKYSIPFESLLLGESKGEKRFYEGIIALVDRSEGASFAVQKQLLRFLELFQRSHPIFAVQRRISALRFRTSKLSCEERRVPTAQEVQSFLQEADLWMKAQTGLDQKTITEENKLELTFALVYDSWKNQLSFPGIKERFFEGVLRFRCRTVIFFLFPGLFETLESPYLFDLFAQERKALFPSFSETSSTSYQILCPLALGNTIDLLDRSKKVTFSFNKQASFQDIIDEVTQSDYKVSSWHYFPSKGLTYFPTNAVWDAVDIEKEEWWRDLPFYIESGELFQDIVPGEALLSLVAVRKDPVIELANNHCYLELVIRQKDCVHVYPFGFFPKKYSQNIVETIETLFGTIEGTWLFPDPNYSTRKREHFRKSEKLTLSELDLLWKILQKQLRAARDGKLAFQLGVMNCATVARLFFNAVKGRKVIAKSCFTVSFNEIEAPPLVGGFLFNLNKVVRLSSLFFEGEGRKTLIPTSRAPYGKEKMINLALLESKGFFSASKLFR